MKRSAFTILMFTGCLMFARINILFGLGFSGINQSNGDPRIYYRMSSDRLIFLSIPPAPSAINPQIYAGNGTIADLTATGTNLKWYNVATGGDVLTANTQLADDNTYYVSQTIDGFESPRTAVTVNKISEAMQTFFNPVTVADLVTIPSAGATAVWYSSASSATPLNPTDALTSGNYYVEQNIPEEIAIVGNGFNAPIDVAVEPDGNILVADHGNNTIYRMNSDGTGIETLGSGFNGVARVAVEADGKILVCDHYNHSIKRMNADGTDIVTLGSGFYYPGGISVETDGKIIVVDHGNHVIKRMNYDGTSIETLAGGFNYPTNAAIEADGKILIADYQNHVVKRMNTDGTGIVTLGSGFDSPVDVAVEPDGKILITEYGTNTLKRMNPDGSGIVVIASGFNQPAAAAREASGTILVADMVNSLMKRITESNTSNRVMVQVLINYTGTAHPDVFGNVNLYPNPSSGKFNLVVTSMLSGIFTIRLISNNGAVIFSSNYTCYGGEKEIPIDVSHLANGEYTLLIQQENKLITRKFSLCK